MHEAILEKSSEWKLLSPDSQIEFVLSLDKEFGKLLYYVVNNGNKYCCLPLGIDREDEKFSSGLQFCSQNEVSLIDEEYELKSGKDRSAIIWQTNKSINSGILMAKWSNSF